MNCSYCGAVQTGSSCTRCGASAEKVQAKPAKADPAGSIFVAFLIALAVVYGAWKLFKPEAAPAPEAPAARQNYAKPAAASEAKDKIVFKCANFVASASAFIGDEGINCD